MYFFGFLTRVPPSFSASAYHCMCSAEDSSSSGYMVDGASGFLPSRRPLPPEPPVKAGPSTASSSSSARPSSAPPLPSLSLSPPLPSTLPLTRPLVKSKARPKARAGPVIPPAWPQPKQLPVPARTVGLRPVYNNPSELGDAINAACADFPGASKILSLDFRNVADRNRDSFLRALRWLDERPEYLLVICSKCSTQSLIDAACAYLHSCLSEVRFHRSVPAFFIPGVPRVVPFCPTAPIGHRCPNACCFRHPSVSSHGSASALLFLNPTASQHPFFPFPPQVFTFVPLLAVKARSHSTC